MVMLVVVWVRGEQVWLCECLGVSRATWTACERPGVACRFLESGERLFLESIKN